MKAATSASAKVSKQSMADSVAQTAQPSKKRLYRASYSIMVLAFRDNHHAAVTVLPGDILEVIGPAQDDRFVIVSIKGEEFLVLQSDLMTRGELFFLGVAQSPR